MSEKNTLTKNPQVLIVKIANGNDKSKKLTLLFAVSSEDIRSGKTEPSLAVVQKALFAAYQEAHAAKLNLSSEWEKNMFGIITKNMKEVAMDCVSFLQAGDADTNIIFTRTGEKPSYFMLEAYYDTNAVVPLVVFRNADAPGNAEEAFKIFAKTVYENIPKEIPKLLPDNLKDIAPVIPHSEWAEAVRNTAKATMEQYGFVMQSALTLAGNTAVLDVNPNNAVS